ncbi:uncharacterized protein CcaverHIS019_0210450 [Cutaneotrichosporon cavernicola]|uniref:Fatty acid hydroxylase domain-containing protein n=1 Tax=Cutaneotrichosporon cavernicola TaxID=279322 RepID=A0AA48IG28_9TREE|nr:uncharacterized protein CcaverHIS019_0210450 [Cutaneotrichosporon cavernicola]BEI89683.1 hypothetical protein CcaverHIS019_0210450 [Cutaneotrichosporon cavernicola]BEI97454.1 hypothetical protein CcaverHIS631_0210430 [Cutaneotrichosporon cavernicola]BEJ05232.1 hypothetical protein CcaverHIS641_0210490 [Cutaneotrichosporon cavernicola]
MISDSPVVMGGAVRRPSANVKTQNSKVDTKAKANGNVNDNVNGKESTYKGKEHNWALQASSRINQDGVWQHVLTIGIIYLTYWINQQPATGRFYDALTAKYGAFNINMWGTWIVSSAVYWTLGLIFMAFDMNDTLHSYVKRFKIQPDRRVTWAEYRQVLVCVVKNQIFVNLPLIYGVSRWAILDTSSNLPGWWKTFGVYFGCMFCEEAGFYFVHRLVHHPKLYAKIHKMHHQFTAPVAFASTYCTLAEQVFSNIGPILIGIVIMRPHWSLMILFFCSLEIGTLCTHSDYNIPGLYDALIHDWHHYAFTENFGPTGLLDDILGTNKQYKVWLAELRRRDGEGWKHAARTALADATQ